MAGEGVEPGKSHRFNDVQCLRKSLACVIDAVTKDDGDVCGGRSSAAEYGDVEGTA